ncbi:MAG: KH domain-containing protein [Deinococcota bacterium]|jgi:spoIIIJ-associated protein|nr:KH domain-containing protein [Deinococcota bacterium]
MADDHLDKYLENLGISMEEEETPASPRDYGEQTLEGGEGEEASAAATDATDAVARCETFLVNLLLNIDPAYAVEVSGGASGELFADIYGGDPGKIIGRNGRTLSALEYLTNTVVNQGEESRRLRVNIDVGGYKRRRDDRLVNTARKAAARVRKTGFAVELEPMSAAERRVVHMELADNVYVYSESTGEGKDRRLVVKPH